MAETHHDTPTYEKPASIIPANDVGRLRALYRYEILDSPPEEFFDKITLMAAKLLQMPSAFISLVDVDRVWYKSNYSTLDVPCVDREDSLCSLTIINDEEVTVFEDTHKIPSLLDSPYVNCDGGIRFYAGAPLVTHDGYQLGTVCVVDSKPRKIKDADKELLQDLASLVMRQIEMRSMARKAIRKHDELHAGLTTEVDFPLQEQEELLEEAKVVPRPVNIVEKALTISRTVRNKVGKLLLESTQETEVILPEREMVSVAALAKEVADEYETVAAANEQELFYSVASRRELFVDPRLLHESLALLVDHLIKYTPQKSSIAIDVFENDGRFRVEISNEESTLTEADLLKMFFKYATLEGKVTGNKVASGLELARARKIVESHGASIWAEATNSGAATKIVVEFQAS